MSIIHCILVFFLLAPGIQAPKEKPDGPEWDINDQYLGQTPPGNTPVKFAPGIISNPGTFEYSITIYPDGSEIYFSRHTPNQSNTTWETKYEYPVWTSPAIASFAQAFYNVPAFCAPDGSRMIFVSDRPLPGQPYDEIQRFWQVQRFISGWSDPELVQGNFNDSLKMGPSLAANGNLYFSERVGGDAFRFYRAIYSDGAYETPELLPASINAFPSVGHIYAAPDESYVIFDAQPDFPASYENFLYISEQRADGSWTPASLLPESINASGTGYLGYVSPDQNYLFFTRDGDIWWVNASEFLPNRQYEGTIAYCYQPLTGNYTHQIYSIKADGSENQKMIDAPIGLNHHSWAPDGLKLAAVGYFPGANETWSIHTFNADGTGLTRLTNTTGIWDSEPFWSPDGSMIVWTRIYPDQNMRNDIWKMDSNGEDQHYLGLEGFAPKYSPDGSLLVYCSNHSGNYEIYTCEADGSNIIQLTSTPEDDWFPCWSPNGQRIIYCTSDNTGSTSYEIRKMNADGSNQIQLTSNNWMDFYPRYSPDGSAITFVSDVSETGKWEVYVMDTTGNAVRRVTYSPENVTAINPAWKPELNPGMEEAGRGDQHAGILKLFPNPCFDQLSITLMVPEPKPILLNVTDLTGRAIIHSEQIFFPAGVHQYSFSTMNLFPGYYIMTMNFGGTLLSSHPFIKQ